MNCPEIKPKRIVQELSIYGAPEEGRLDYIRLDFNENTAPVFQPQFSSYPEYGDLTDSLTEIFNTDKDSILATNGTDEALFLIANTFIEPGEDTALISSPTFAMIKRSLLLAGAELQEVPLSKELKYDTAGLEKKLESKNIKLAIFASPDNPSGALLDLSILESWCRRYPNTLFVVDEAYAEYANVDATVLTKSFNNLLVTRTFSKAWGNAGLRLGVIIGAAKLLRMIESLKMPYSVNAVASKVDQELVQYKKAILKDAASTMVRKEFMIESLKDLGYTAIKGNANFFLLNVGFYAEQFCQFLKSKGILVRNRSNSNNKRDLLWGRVRISVGTEAENAALIEAVREWNSSYIVGFDLDDTLVDTTKSFDKTIESVYEKFTGQRFNQSELVNLRNRGGFNDDWDATYTLIKESGVDVSKDEIIQECIQLYLSLAASVEKPLACFDFLSEIMIRHKLGIVTGRNESEYQNWKSTFDALNIKAILKDDRSGLKAKPSPDYLELLKRRFSCSRGVYIGNSVDDMQAARSADLTAIGIASGEQQGVLRRNGAQFVLENVASINDYMRM